MQTQGVNYVSYAHIYSQQHSIVIITRQTSSSENKDMEMCLYKLHQHKRRHWCLVYVSVWEREEDLFLSISSRNKAFSAFVLKI